MVILILFDRKKLMSFYTMLAFFGLKGKKISQYFLYFFGYLFYL